MESLPIDPRRRRRALAASLLALVAAVVGGIALGFLEPAGQVQRLPDGSLLELRGVTFGTDTRFFDGNGWQRVLYGFGWSSSSLGGFLNTWPGGELNLWFRFRTAPEAPVDPPAGWIDEHGCRILVGGGGLGTTSNFLGGIPSYGSGGDPRYRLAAPEILPRRQETATFAFMGDTGDSTHAAFTVPLPPGKPIVEWPGERLPVKCRVVDTTFTLTGLRHRKGKPFDATEATFTYSGATPHSRNWRPYRVTVSDATGNQSTTLRNGTPDDPRQVTFDSLCTHEPAWKIQTQFTRAQPMQAPPDLVWTVRNLRAPGPGQAIDRHDGFRQGDTTLRLQMVHGEGSFNWQGGVGSSIYPGLHLEVECPEGAHVQILRLTDQGGRDLLGANSGHFPNIYVGESSEADHNSVGLLFDYPARTTRLNVTFGVWKMRTAEFLVRP